jgi:ubiquitin carboxyl-terminal hydrolase 14
MWESSREFSKSGVGSVSPQRVICAYASLQLFRAYTHEIRLGLYCDPSFLIMPELSVTIKHAGKTYPLSLNTDLPPTVFKQIIYEATGVPADRMKVMVKGGVLKDDHDWNKAAIKPNSTITVIGAAGPLPQAPEKATVFLEDMDEADLASAVGGRTSTSIFRCIDCITQLAVPVGLKNLGNTCYMNATVQALRAIPELQTALSNANSTGPNSLPGTLRDLYNNMSRTTDAVIPISFLQALRGFAPQFAEVDRGRAGKDARTGSGPSAGLTGAAAMLGMGGGYAQQDAEECWTAIQSGLKDVPGTKQDGQERATSNFIDQYMATEVRRE